MLTPIQQYQKFQHEKDTEHLARGFAMKLRVECGDMTTRAGYRPGMLIVDLDEVTLKDFNPKEVLNQVDVKEVMEWLTEQGYTVIEEQAA